jgi:hypothetical protein
MRLPLRRQSGQGIIKSFPSALNGWRIKCLKFLHDVAMPVKKPVAKFIFSE